MSATESYEDPFYIHIDNFRDAEISLEARGAVMDLLCCIYWPLKQAFEFDAISIADRLNAIFPARDYSPELLERLRPELSMFFVVLDDGRWAPSPTYFSLTDGNAEFLASQTN